MTRDEDDFEKQMSLVNQSDKTAVSETYHLKHRLINLRGEFWKNKFRTSRMTTSARKTSLTIGMGSCQGTLM
jgi:hypothetical protein